MDTLVYVDLETPFERELIEWELQKAAALVEALRAGEGEGLLKGPVRLAFLPDFQECFLVDSEGRKARMDSCVLQLFFRCSRCRHEGFDREDFDCSVPGRELCCFCSEEGLA